ncbi:GNAT family N-acetyltransferase [Natronorubrum sp. JWXQ-INN-674]|uniref:GNAT family N-acetyltransferase n=1 Tax=Natronorubrum halalkaliphilum TaxID=2691917 RepID=A0A6B0VL00_9EURY|nr:GNAT family N-acetyltransferase [Natronorubrum halalkaliphilum]MXV61863.1 GNAT family N-acetyltransferase [Natronorubrum halalkaliphilum]
MMDIQISPDETDWNQFIESNSGPIFNRNEWSAICSIYGHKSYNMAVINDSGDICACLPLIHLKSAIFGNTLVSMPFSEHGSIVIDESINDRNQAVDLLRGKAQELAQQKGVDYLCLRGSRYPSSKEFIRLSRYVTFVVETNSSMEDIWDSFETRFRTNIRNSRDHSLTTQVVENEASNFSHDPVSSYYNLHLRTMRDLGSPPHAKSFFVNIWRKLGKIDGAIFIFVIYDGIPINAALAFPYGDTVHYWGAVSKPNYRHLNGGSLLLWKCIKWAQNNGYQQVDLGRTRPGTGVYKFKSGTNGQEIYLDDLFYFPEEISMPPDPEDSKFTPLIRIWRQLPLSVTEALGPHLRGNIP